MSRIFFHISQTRTLSEFLPQQPNQISLRAEKQNSFADIRLPASAFAVAMIQAEMHVCLYCTLDKMERGCLTYRSLVARSPPPSQDVSKASLSSSTILDGQGQRDRHANRFQEGRNHNMHTFLRTLAATPHVDFSLRSYLF